MYEQELEQEYGRKKELLEDLVGITGALKESTLGIHHTVRKQNVQLDEMQHFAWQNADSLDQQRKKVSLLILLLFSVIFQYLQHGDLPHS